MAAAHPVDDLHLIPTSDQEEEDENQGVQYFGSLSHLQMETMETVTSVTDTQNNDNQLFEVVNEHNEVLHVFSEQIQVPPAIVNNPTSQHIYNTTEETRDYQPPPPPVPLREEMFSSSESESSDTPHYILDSSEEEEEEDLVPQIRIPIKNYPNDTEHEEDFSDGWLWLEEDPGASYGPFTGNPGLNIPPSQKVPRNYFELFFDPAMYTKISSETNNYARQRIQNVTGYLLQYHLNFHSAFTLLLL